MLNLVRLFLALTTILIIIHVHAGSDPSLKAYSIKGKIFTNGCKPLPGAHILVNGTREGCISDSSGNFDIKVLAGLYPLRVSFVGYHPFDTTVYVTGPISVDIYLIPEEHSLDEVTITAAAMHEAPAGYLTMDRKSLDKIPVLMGERDFLKSCQYLPGIHSVVDGNTGISVRGGNIDENLVLLDQATIYNPSHLLGFFSAFNSDAIKEVQVFKGNNPSALGGRLSSVFDVKMADGMTPEIQGVTEIGLISSKLTLNGPIIKEKLSFNISGRRSYADLFMPYLNPPDYKDTRIYFYDTYGKLTACLSPGHTLSLSTYLGRDVFRNHYAYSGYGNKMASLQWEFKGKNGLNGGSGITYSDYTYQLGTYHANKPNSFSWESGIKEYGFRQYFNMPISSSQTLDFGLQLKYYHFDPYIITGKGQNSLLNDYTLAMGQGFEGAIYAEHSFQLSPRFKVKYGIRLTGFTDPASLLRINKSDALDDHPSDKNTGNWHENISGGPEPRLRISYRFFREWWAGLSFSRNQQFIHLANTSLAGNPLDVWFPSDDKILPERSDQVVLGINGPFIKGKIKLSIEAFYKKMNRSHEFQDHARLIGEVDFSDEIIQGEGWASGLEIMLIKESGKVSGWISYAYTRSFKKFHEINNKQPFPSSYEIPHDVSAVISYTISERFNMSAAWVFSSGKPYTAPASAAYISGIIVPVYASRNSSRAPDYHRLDLSLTLCSKPSRKLNSEWIFSVYNVYNRKNVMNLQLIPEENNAFDLKLNRNYLFPILPSVSYRVKF